MTYNDESPVLVRFPLSREQELGDREAWPWLPGWIVSRCGPDEWEVCVETDELAVQSGGETFYPCCFRDSSELRPRDEP
jgi:hypothetical protein